MENEVHCWALLPHERQELCSGFRLPDCPAIVQDTQAHARQVSCCCTMLPALAESSGVDSGLGEGDGRRVGPECLLAVPPPSWVANTCHFPSMVWKSLCLDFRNRVDGKRSVLGYTHDGAIGDHCAKALC